ncbi:PREDICTED: ankyrin repeat domain-containing protein 49-like [Branchiostoma belcheri]|uniref:Ankyrin repeat domain-containing protein 49-like n=1 Tax=Branchiostoma belcheri TaxID=7741 RepID=A0A6P4Z5Y3_BRABE|nr:PREDICTED: ankyrin repeat domain-containing protein 49-like [Branchiostoma belcheri]
MDGREQETMEEDEESGSEEAGSEVSSSEDEDEDEKALRKAAEEGNTDRVKQLLAEGVNPNAAAGISQMTPLHRAAGSGHHETVSALLTAGADVNARDDEVGRLTAVTQKHFISLMGFDIYLQLYSSLLGKFR